VVASDAFYVNRPPDESVRVCLGGPASRETVRRALEYMSHALEGQPELATSYL
jgi:hypothetical protein